MSFRLKTGLQNVGRFLFAVGGGMVVGIGLVATIQTLAMSIPQTDSGKSVSLRQMEPTGISVDAAQAGEITTDMSQILTAAAKMDPSSRTPALRYAEALMAGDGDTAAGMLSWVRDRLTHVQHTRGAGEPVRQERERIARQILDRSPEGAVVRAEGIDDQHVFVPGCRLERIGHDEGAPDLEAPAAGRDWIRVTYPNQAIAPRTPAGKPFHHLVVGINWDANGMILKGNIIGNLEIDLEASSR